MSPLITKLIRPPIPTTRFDWLAYRDGNEEFGPFGFGKTEAEAIEELREAEEP